MVATVGDIEAARGKTAVAVFEELHRGEVFRGDGACEGIADDDVAAGGGEGFGDDAGILDTDLHAWGTGDVEPLTGQTGKLTVELDHGVTGLRVHIGEVTGHRAGTTTEVGDAELIGV